MKIAYLVSDIIFIEKLKRIFRKLRYENYNLFPNLFNLEPNTDIIIVNIDDILNKTNKITIENNTNSRKRLDEPALKGFVIGYMYNTIIDGYSTELDKFLDGKIFLPDDKFLRQLWPPNYPNDRTIITSITKDMGPIEQTFIITEEIALEALKLKNQLLNNASIIEKLNSTGIKTIGYTTSEYQIESEILASFTRVVNKNQVNTNLDELIKQTLANNI